MFAVDDNKDNRVQNLEYQLKEMKLKYELIEYNSNKKLKELQDRNRYLSSLLLSNDRRISVQDYDEDTNSFYMKRLQNRNTDTNN